MTGGPCAGKSTALASVKEHFQEKGWLVVTINETATELIASGLRREYCTDMQFQIRVMQLQLAKERTFEEAVRDLGFEKVLIVCDRGILDNRAYIPDDVYRQVLEINGITHEQACARYDAVFHMQSAAVGAPRHYNLSSNATRRENAQEAARLDERIGLAWRDHPRFFTIEASDDFEEKIDRLIRQIETVEQ
ncbi:MAG: ATP-binding protein [Eggerthellaceae bacterium]|nr:ATP-binding protein [Eggerthellaceae bacterium]MDY4986695.1 ATP-binding protein [Eggerthellaceae bacterium]